MSEPNEAQEPVSERRPGRARQASVLQRFASLLFGPADTGPGREVLNLLAFLWVMIGIGLVSLLPPALVQTSWPAGLKVIGVGLFITGAGVAVGSMFGFLFGVPRSNVDLLGPDGVPNSGDEPSYVPNTNLETISDWFTKLVIGAGLVQLKEIVPWIGQMGATAGAAMTSPEEPLTVIATALLVHSVLMGFFQGFLVAYLYLPKAFAAARLSARHGDSS